MVIKQVYKKILLSLAVFAGVTLLIFHLFFLSTSPLDKTASLVLYPFLKLQTRVSNIVTSYMHKRNTMSMLHTKLHQLHEEKEKLLAQTIELQSLIDVEQETQELREFKQRYHDINARAAQVLVKNFSDQTHFFLIDKGSRASIHPDMVAVYKNCLVGRVSEVYPYYSKVILLTDRTCHVSALCAVSKATGIYHGINQLYEGSVQHVSHLCPIEYEELLLSSGDGLVFPRGFGIGRIKSFVTTNLFHEIKVEPLVDFQAIKYVYVVQKGSFLASEDNESIPEKISLMAAGRT